MHGQGFRRKCPECGQDVSHIKDRLSHRELQGPRNISSTNVDRLFDDNGNRFLYIEEKNTREASISKGQLRALRALSNYPENEVWIVKGNPSRLSVYQLNGADHAALITGGTWIEYQQLVFDWFAAYGVILVAEPQPELFK